MNAPSGSSARCRRVIATRYGGPEVLQTIEEDLPQPRPGEVRVKIRAAGVSYADMLMREGVHPETRRVPFTPGWDVVGEVDCLGEGVSTVKLGQMAAAMPIVGGYAEFICLRPEELVPVPAGLDPAEAVSLILNYVTAYQMMHRSAHAEPGQRALIHSAAGGVGTALLQLGRLAGLEMYGTASRTAHPFVRDLGAVPIDYKEQDFVEEIFRLTGDGVDIVFDGIGGSHMWRSFKTLRARGRVVAYGLTSTLREGRVVAGRRFRFRGFGYFGRYIVGAFLSPGRKRFIPYSIQTLKRLKPAWFREDLTTLLNLLQQGKVKPIIAERLPLTDARRAHELLGRGSILGKIVLLNAG
jgi:NADPH:quinone reductase-like Zn-dependent oxidoreductase